MTWMQFLPKLKSPVLFLFQGIFDFLPDIALFFFGWIGAGYMIDLRDALVYGEQFVNNALVRGNMNVVDLPKASGGKLLKRYPTLTDAQSVFVDDAAAGTAQFLETDGVMDVNLSTFVADEGTPPVARLSV